MTSLEDVEKRLMDVLLEDHAVAVTLQGLRGSKSGFSVLLPEVPRPGDLLTFALKHRRGQGRYVVQRVEWVVAKYKEVLVYLEPVAK
jgi:hypothetical protein